MKTFILLFLFVTSAFAQISRPELIVVATDQGGYPAPTMCFFSNQHMIPHPEGLLVQYMCFGGPDLYSEIWLVNKESRRIGRSQYGNLLTHAYVRNSSIYFFEFSELKTVALWEDTEGKLTRHEIPEKLKNSHIHDFALLGNDFRFRYTDNKTRERGEGFFSDQFQILPTRDVKFFYKAFGTGRIFLQKVILDNGEAVELRTEASPSPVIVLRDKKLDPASPYTFLRSQFAAHGDNWVTIASTEEGLVLVRGKGTSYTTEDLSPYFKDIQHWPPALSPSGEIIFRAKDRQDEFALWGYKDGVARVIVGSGQEVFVDGARILTSSRSLLYNSPVFDAEGRLTIGVGLRFPDESSDFGQGVLRLEL